MTLYLNKSENEQIGQVATMNSVKEKGFWRNFRKYLREYNEVTGIHGLRYLTEKRSTVEKVFWGIILLMSLAWCIYMIYEIVDKYQNSPVVVSFATKDTPVYDIPFPAVTICPEARSSKKKFSYTDVLTKLENDSSVTEEEFMVFQYMSHICGNDNEESGYSSNLTEHFDFDRFFEKIDEYKPNIGIICSFMEGVENAESNCEEMFTPIITDQGICYSFNIVSKKELFRDHVVYHQDFYQIVNDSHNFDGESGYRDEAGVHTYPRRALMSGADNSLDIFLLINQKDTDYLCSDFHQGFRVMVHNPLDVPRLSKHYFRIPLERSVVAAIQPELVTTSDAVKNFKPDKRQCYLRSERPLKHFRIYTQSNCQLECVTNYTLNKCGCVSFFMPRDDSTKICGAGKSKCLEAAENELKIKELENKISKKSKNYHHSCDCKPLCTDLKYNLETSHSDFLWKEFVKRHNFSFIGEEDNDADADYSYSMFSIYFKSEQFMTLERNELYGVSDLVSNFGGLLGLFTGFSLISLAEIIYYLTLRIFYNERIYGMWSGPPSS